MAAPRLTKTEELQHALGMAVARADALQATVESLNKGLAQAIAEGNEFRDQLHASELELSRLRGYLQARDEAEPPRMVPEHPRQRAHEMHIDYRIGPDFGHPRSVPWYHRRS